MHITIILGTGRIGRQSEKVANFMLQEVKKTGNGTELIDVRDYRIEVTDRTGESRHAKTFAEKIKKTDALIMVSPEYNHSYPGELKMMLDMLYDEYAGKPVGICGVSSGQFGGARMAEKLKLLCLELGMAPVRETVYFGNVQDLFDGNGKIKKQEYQERVKRLVEKLNVPIKN